MAVGPKKGNEILIPRIKFQPKDLNLPIEFERVQFPVRQCFAITSNKAQGQTYEFIGVNMKNNFFAHGQTYVAFSRVGSYKKIKIFQPKSTFNRGYIKNIVFQEILSKGGTKSMCVQDNDV